MSSQIITLAIQPRPGAGRNEGIRTTTSRSQRSSEGTIFSNLNALAILCQSKQESDVSSTLWTWLFWHGANSLRQQPPTWRPSLSKAWLSALFSPRPIEAIVLKVRRQARTARSEARRRVSSAFYQVRFLWPSTGCTWRSGNRTFKPRVT